MDSLCKSCLALTIVLASISITESALYQVCHGKPADIVFVIDESSSIWPVDFKKLHPFLRSVADSFDISPEHTRIAAITFSDKVTHRFSLSAYKNAKDVKNAITRIDQKTGGTRTDKALKYVRHKIFSEERPEVPKIVILITDGASWYPHLTSNEARLLRDNLNATIFTVAISNKINWEEIESIASKPTEHHVFSVNSFDDLGDALVQKLVASTCEIQGNAVGECTIDFTSDIMFVLGSASQNPAGAVNAMSMIQDIIDDKNTFVGESLLRFGLVPKQCDLDLGFDLNQYYNKEDMLNHLERKKSRLSAADHLDYMTKISFSPSQGDREDVRNLAVVILDRASGDYAATIAAAQRAKNAGIEIIAVAVGKEVNDAEITAIASQPSERYKITLSDYSEGADLKHKFYSLICP